MRITNLLPEPCCSAFVFPSTVKKSLQADCETSENKRAANVCQIWLFLSFRRLVALLSSTRNQSDEHFPLRCARTKGLHKSDHHVMKWAPVRDWDNQRLSQRLLKIIHKFRIIVVRWWWDHRWPNNRHAHKWIICSKSSQYGRELIFSYAIN